MPYADGGSSYRDGRVPRPGFDTVPREQGTPYFRYDFSTFDIKPYAESPTSWFHVYGLLYKPCAECENTDDE